MDSLTTFDPSETVRRPRSIDMRLLLTPCVDRLHHHPGHPSQEGELPAIGSPKLID